MADEQHLPAVRGDEGDLFRAYNSSLMRSISGSVRVSTEDTVEDACAFAWAKFLENQPDRDRNWRAWLFRTAQRKAWLLEQQRADQRCAGLHVARDSGEALDELELWERVDETLSLVRGLPPRLRRVTMLRALGFKYGEIGELTGDSAARLQQLVGRANDHLWTVIAKRERAVRERLSPRAERLWQLEEQAPAWLVERIGKPIRNASRRPSGSELRRAWRRAALALDDYRHAIGPSRFDHGGREPLVDESFRRLHARAMAAVDAVQLERDKGRRHGREL